MKPEIERRLLKILALAERGVGGEKRNAQSILERLLKQHGLTLDDLIQEETPDVGRSYHYQNHPEKIVLMQCYARVKNSHTIPYLKIRGSQRLKFWMSELQHIELSEMYRFYKALLKEEMETLITAFIYQHSIHSHTNEEDKGEDDTDPEELRRIIEKMRTLRRDKFVSTRRRLT